MLHIVSSEHIFEWRMKFWEPVSNRSISRTREEKEKWNTIMCFLITILTDQIDHSPCPNVCVCARTHVCAHNFFLKVCEKQTSPDPDFTQLCNKSFSLFNRQKKSIIYGCIYRDVIYKAKVIFNKFCINGFHN